MTKKNNEVTIFQCDLNGGIYAYHTSKKNVRKFVNSGELSSYNIVVSEDLDFECNLDTYIKPFLIIIDSGTHYKAKKAVKCNGKS